MIHPTYRSLDAPVKLLGLSWRQWLALLAGGGALVLFVRWTGLPTRPAISACTVLIGVPLALAYLSEETGFGFGRLVLDLARWTTAARRFDPGAGAGRVRGLVVGAVETGEMAPRNGDGQ